MSINEFAEILTTILQRRNPTLVADVDGESLVVGEKRFPFERKGDFICVSAPFFRVAGHIDTIDQIAESLASEQLRLLV
nr:hypothetical protein K-LCC10_0216 [Kaumoebavirus]